MKWLYFILCIYSIYCKNVVFPFKKLTIEYLEEKKSIADFIDYTIYTNISVGTPPQTVAHFFQDEENNIFSYRSMQIQYHETKDYQEKEKIVEDAINIYFNYTSSATYQDEDKYFCLYSDLFNFYNIDGEEYNIRVKFAFTNNAANKVYGFLDLFSKMDYEKGSVYFFKELKDNELIDGYYFTYIYENNYTFLDDDYTKTLGHLIIGEALHEFNPGLYLKDDEIKVNARYYLAIDELKMRSLISNYTENSVNIYIYSHKGFIKGSVEYRKEIEAIFFKELINKNLCKIDYVSENNYISQDYIYSCVNNDYMKERIKNFPTLYLEIKQYNLTFLFNYQELFQLHDNRLYFLIMFKNKTSDWSFGEIFLRKYTSSYNYDSKTISFYKKQVDDINSKTDIHPDPDDSDEYITDTPSDDSSDIAPNDNNYTGKIVRIIIEVIMGVIIVVVVTILIIRFRKSRKKRANELKDEYEYVSDEKIY